MNKEREEKLPLAPKHLDLFEKMELIDQTLDYYALHREKKGLLFDKLKESLIQSSKIFISMKTIRQLLFINEECYRTEWVMIDEKKNSFQLKISLPRY